MPEDRAAALVARLSEGTQDEHPWLPRERVTHFVVAELRRMANAGDWVALVALHRHYRQRQPAPSPAPHSHTVA